MAVRKVVGLGVYFLGLGLWVVVLTVGAVAVLPWVALAFAAGYMSHVREWPSIRDFRIWAWLRNDYFRFELRGELPPVEETVVYAIYPHGHFAVTSLIFFALNPRFAKAKAAVHSFLFWVPLFSTFVRWIGAVDVSREAMLATLRAGTSIYMTPGGVAEISLQGDQIKKRSGFLSVARDAGVRVVPVWCPAERGYYSQITPLGFTLERWLYFPIPMILWGLWWCPLLPCQPEVVSEVRVGSCMDPADESAFWDEMRRLQTPARAAEGVRRPRAAK